MTQILKTICWLVFLYGLTQFLDASELVVDSNNMDWAAITECMNDPNCKVVLPEKPPAPVPAPSAIVDFPELGQWLQQASEKEIKIEVPKDETIIKNIKLGGRVEWFLINGQWKPVAYNNDTPITYTYRLVPVAAKLYIDSQPIDLIKSGIQSFSMKVIVNPSCDATGDGIVNFHDFALWAANWKGE